MITVTAKQEPTVLTPERAMQLLYGIVGYVSTERFERREDIIKKLIKMGFKPDELEFIFHFPGSDIDYVLKEICEEEEVAYDNR